LSVHEIAKLLSIIHGARIPFPVPVKALNATLTGAPVEEALKNPRPGNTCRLALLSTPASPENAYEDLPMNV